MVMRKLIFFLCLVLLFSFSLSSATGPGCGDDVCGASETTISCPDDCGSTDTNTCKGALCRIGDLYNKNPDIFYQVGAIGVVFVLIIGFLVFSKPPTYE